MSNDVTTTHKQRGLTYGRFEDHAVISQRLQDGIRECQNWDNLKPIQKQALSVIMDKIARIMNGDPMYSDSWHDIGGYAKLVENWIQENNTTDVYIGGGALHINGPVPNNVSLMSSLTVNPT